MQVREINLDGTPKAPYMHRNYGNTIPLRVELHIQQEPQNQLALLNYT
jgi:hypothetical protein